MAEKKIKKIQLTRAEMMDLTKAVENYKQSRKNAKQKYTAADESFITAKMANSIVRRRKGGL